MVGQSTAQRVTGLVQPVKLMQAAPGDASAVTHSASLVQGVAVPARAQKLAPPVVRKQKQELPPSPQAPALVAQKFCAAVQVETSWALQCLCLHRLEQH